MLGVLSLCCLFKACALSQNGNGHSGIPRHLHTYSCIHPNGGIVGELWECEPFRYQQLVQTTVAQAGFHPCALKAAYRACATCLDGGSRWHYVPPMAHNLLRWTRTKFRLVERSGDLVCSVDDNPGRVYVMLADHICSSSLASPELEPYVSGRLVVTNAA